MLREQLPSVEWTFETLPVTWQTSATLDLLAYDVVIHIGKLFMFIFTSVTSLEFYGCTEW